MRIYLEKLAFILRFTLPFFSILGFWTGSWLLAQPQPAVWCIGLYVGVTLFSMQSILVTIQYWPKFERKFLLYETITQHIIYGTRRLNLRPSLKAMWAGIGISILVTLLGYRSSLFWYAVLPLGGFNVLALFSVVGCHVWCHLRTRDYRGFVTVMRIDSHIKLAAGMETICEVCPVEDLSDLLLTDLGFVLSHEEFLQVLTFQR